MTNYQRVLDEVCARRKIPGAVLGVVHDGEKSVATFGIANLNTGLPVVRKTLFQAGSIGKSYTATAVMQLVDEGLVDLDVPLRDYLHDLQFADAEASKTLTARQILTHTAGIDGDRLDDEGACGRGEDCLERYVTSLTDLPLIAAPGGPWSYCNSGYIVLGRLIEVVTGQTYEQAVTKRLLEPLGVTDTLFFPGDMVTRSLAVGHVREGDGDPVVAPRWEMSRAAGPAGSTINTTIDDLLAFAQMHLRGGLAADGTRVLSAESVRAMKQPLVACPEPELLGDHWGLGWFIRSGTAQRPSVIGHDGNTIGLTSCLRLIPERGAAWALLMNLSGQNWAGQEVAAAAFDPWLGTLTPPAPQATGTTVPDAGKYLGTFESVGSRLVVTAEDDRLHLAVHAVDRPAGTDDLERMRGDLLPGGGDRFLLRVPALGDDSLPVSFLEPSAHGFGYLHMGARLHRRVGG